MAEEYSLNDLVQIQNAYQNVLDKDKDYKIKFVYLLRKNIKKTRDEIQDIRDQFTDDVEGMDEFHEKRFEIAKDLGGKVQQFPNGTKTIKNIDEIDQERYEERIDELKDEYADILEQQEDVVEQNMEIANESMAKVDFEKIPLDIFNDDISPDELPLEFIEYDLIKEE